MIQNTQDTYLKQKKIQDTDYKAIWRKMLLKNHNKYNVSNVFIVLSFIIKVDIVKVLTETKSTFLQTFFFILIYSWHIYIHCFFAYRHEIQ